MKEVKNFIVKNMIWINSIVAVAGLVYLCIGEKIAPGQRAILLWFFAIMLHEWEEFRIPGGFTEMVQKNVGFDAGDATQAHFYVLVLVLFFAVVGMAFPSVGCLVFGPLFIGVLELFAHCMCSILFHIKGFYNPGMLTTLITCPVSVYGIVLITRAGELSPLMVVIGIIYAAILFVRVQLFVINSQKMTYREYAANAKKVMSARIKGK